MKYLLPILILIPGHLFCQDQLLGSRAREINETDKELKKIKEVKFGGGDVWGTIYYYSNRDSTKVKIVEAYDAGDYGNGEIEYYINKGKLIYKKELTIEWLASDSKSDNYKFKETKYYFADGGQGIKTSKEIFSASTDISDNERKKLKEKKSDSSPLDKGDVDTQKKTLVETLSRRSN